MANWKTFFSDKTLDSDQLTLINNDEIISADENIAKTFNEIFSNVNNLNLKIDKSLLNQTTDLVEDPVLRALKHYENLLSIEGINEMLKEDFFFSALQLSQILKND